MISDRAPAVPIAAHIMAIIAMNSIAIGSSRGSPDIISNVLGGDAETWMG